MVSGAPGAVQTPKTGRSGFGSLPPGEGPPPKALPKAVAGGAWERAFWGVVPGCSQLPVQKGPDPTLGFLIHGGHARVFNTWIF